MKFLLYAGPHNFCREEDQTEPNKDIRQAYICFLRVKNIIIMLKKKRR